MSTTAASVLQVILVIAVLALVIGRRFTPRPVRGDGRRWRLPLILVAIGVYSLYGLGHGSKPVTWTGADLAYIAIGLAVSVVLGATRGFTLHIYEQGGTLMQRYRPLTALLWVVLIAVRIGMDLSATGLGVASAVAGGSILLMFGASLLGEAAAVTLRVAGSGPGGGWGVQGAGPQ
ncbi:MAG TPA: hypothetical protein VGM10_01300 [Actinocrinis sp.]|jgi:hypothetical protein